MKHITLIVACTAMTMVASHSVHAADPPDSARAPTKPEESSAHGDASKDVIRIEMGSTKAKSDKSASGGLLTLLFSAGAKQSLKSEGKLTLDGETHKLYLPKAKSYAIDRDNQEVNHHSNNNPQIFVDANSDEFGDDDEAWFANLPLRIGDKMFNVVAIGDNAEYIDLRPSNSPLRGAVVGRKCPDFDLPLQDGGNAQLADYRGKAFLLDIWSVT